LGVALTLLDFTLVAIVPPNYVEQLSV